MKIFLAGSGLILVVCCREPYNPPVIQNPPSYLVVDGVIKAGDSTVIILSRSHSLNDSVSNVPETGAQVTVVGSSSDSYSLTENAGGIYSANTLPLNPSETYQLKITTGDGKQYESDMVPVQQTPPIDSVNWTYDEATGVNIYVNTHDPQNNTKYYRWEYVETWEYHTNYYSYLYYDDGQLYNRPNQIYTCWQTNNSTELFLATTSVLTKDLVYEFPLVFIPQPDMKMSVKYSILVRQYALTESAYNFWENLKKNTELTGSIFAPQPFQSNGNIHCISNPSEPVLGYISACSVQLQRIFITNQELATWHYKQPDCVIQKVTPDSVDYYFGEAGYIPIAVNVPNGYVGSTRECVDCTLYGGSPIEPLFWQ